MSRSGPGQSFVYDIPDVVLEGMIGEEITADRGEGAGLESLGYSGDWEETVRIGSFERQEHEIASSPLPRGLCMTGNSLRLVGARQRSMVISEDAL